MRLFKQLACELIVVYPGNLNAPSASFFMVEDKIKHIGKVLSLDIRRMQCAHPGAGGELSIIKLGMEIFCV